MAAQPSVDDSFTFVGGLNSEGGFFVTPKNSWKEGDNVTPSTDGSITRRKALDFEENYQLAPRGAFAVDVNKWAYTIDTWYSVNGNGNLEFFVVQEGPTLSFYKAASGTVSASKLPTEIDLSTFQCFGNTSVVGSNVVTCASSYGKLVVTSIDTDPVLLTYDEPTNTITAKRLTLKIRDFTGIRSPEPANTSLTEAQWATLNFLPEAMYNLYNQGWTDDKILLYKNGNANKIPSNSQQWIYGKDSNGDFDSAVLAKVDFGTSEAPKGRFILQAFYQDRGTASGNVPGTTPQTPVIPPYPNFNDGLDFTNPLVNIP
jgi:hypothetical protein